MNKLALIIFVLVILCGCNNKKEVVFVEKTNDITITQSVETTEKMIVEGNRIYIADGFSYGDIGEDTEKRITGVSLPDNAKGITVDQLSYIRIKYYDFDGMVKDGELIVNKKVAVEVTEIFFELYKAKYPLASVRLVDDFNADDERSMSANNTSAFNYRTIAGSSKLSMHGKGLAIDINPLYNPCVTQNSISPSSAKSYADRSKSFVGKIDKEDLAYKLFTEKGWTWGGNWRSLKDYQHFEKQL